MSATIELTPPETLTPPAAVAPVEKEQAAGMVKLAPAKFQELDKKVEDFVNIILNEQLHSEAFKAKVSGVHTLANDEIRAAAGISNRLLDKPMQAMNTGLFDEGSAISKSLLDLRVRIEALDPVKQGNLLEPRKLLGFIPMGTKVQDYFRQYQSAQTHLNAILESLYHGQDELRKDNAAVEEEKANAWRIMERLEQYVYVGKKIDAAISARLTEIEGQDPEKARVVKEELLFYVRQKVQDLLTQLAVTIQGYLAMDMIRKNNLELIKGVDRATTTTISALRTAVIVAQALANQKLVLDQIGALNATTSGMIESTSALLKQQAGRVHEQASSAAVSLDKLKLAFQNIYDTMDMVSSYKVKALENMQKTVDVLGAEVEKSKSYLDRTRQETVRQVSATLTTASGDEIRL
ncbi:toxic anion resistance protein [Methylomagnum ishizawai]|uniref:toxic anion resistance protein n=1 Tax=Methylomagnum ishizawai TaxID=1760988 RepID=UPI001C32398F|nr:toxic anion resistance protein [Methylomagnum ishizawai]BBL73954.1 toxic anion resistance protein [Methylomagnum ishizawai]